MELRSFVQVCKCLSTLLCVFVTTCRCTFVEVRVDVHQYDQTFISQSQQSPRLKKAPHACLLLRHLQGCGPWIHVLQWQLDTIITTLPFTACFYMQVLWLDQHHRCSPPTLLIRCGWLLPFSLNKIQAEGSLQIIDAALENRTSSEKLYKVTTLKGILWNWNQVKILLVKGEV